MKIVAPRTLKDYKLKHASRLMALASQEDATELTFSNKVQHVSAYTDSSIEELRELPKSAINTIFNDCIANLSTYVKAEPLKEVEVEGVKYVLVDIHKQTAGWLIDFEVEQELFQTQPEKMVALCYIEKGKNYGDVPKPERELIFKDHFPAYLFFDLNAFFLLHYVNYTTALALLQNIRAKKMLKKEKRRRRIRTLLRMQPK